MAQLQSTSITGTFKIGCTPDTGSTGNLWFDTDSNTLAIATALKSWSAVADMINLRCQGASSAGDQNSAIVFSGDPTATNCTEEFNGSSWSVGGNMINTHLYVANGGTGTQNAALAIGPPSVASSEEYNGTSWATGGGFSSPTTTIGLGGSQNSAIAIGCCDIVCFYNGSSWSAAASIPFNSPTGKALGAATSGPSCSNIIASTGNYPPALCSKQFASFNGTTWTEESSFNRFAMYFQGNQEYYKRLGGCSTQAVSTAFGATEEYDGTSWSIGGNDIRSFGIYTPVCGRGSAATGYDMLAAGGRGSPQGYQVSKYGALSGTVKYIGK